MLKKSRMPDPKLILGNSNKRFSGVTSTLLQVLEHQKSLTALAVLGPHHLPLNTPTLTLTQAARLKSLPDGSPRIFHARRNDEMIQALILKKIFRQNLKIAFTSTAQRHHSKFTKYLISKMDGIISTCAAAASYLERKPDIIIPHGIDADLYTPAENKSLAWQSLGYPGKYGIGIFGRIRPSKGIDILIDAAIPLLQKHPDFTIIICGETTPKFQAYQNQLQTKINEANLTERIRFIGKQPFSELPKLFRAMSIAAALSRTEGFGLTVLEAMSSGTAVLTSEAGAWKEIVQNGTHGYHVPTRDIPATREKLDHLMSHPENLTQLGINGRDYIQKHHTTQQEATALTSYLLSLTK